MTEDEIREAWDSWTPMVKLHSVREQELLDQINELEKLLVRNRTRQSVAFWLMFLAWLLAFAAWQLGL